MDNGFPYIWTYDNRNPIDILNSIGEYRLNVDHNMPKNTRYIPTYSFYLPLYYGSKVVHMLTSNDYDEYNCITDFYSQEQRLKASVDDFASPIERFNQNVNNGSLEQLKKKNKITTQKELNSYIYNNWKSANLFGITWAREILLLIFHNESNLRGKLWLDISAGWGDRLIAAISLNMNYIGYDPNINMKSSYQNIINQLSRNGSYNIILEPFETAELPKEQVDIIFSSPPFFDRETYDNSSGGQSSANYTTFERWLSMFLFVALNRAWSTLKENGYMILYISDSKQVIFCEATMMYIEKFLINSSYEGCMILNESPVWIWKKSVERKIWSSFIPRSFKDYYKELAPYIASTQTSLLINGYNDWYQKCSFIIDNIHKNTGVPINTLEFTLRPVLPFFIQSFNIDESYNRALSIIKEL